MTIAETALLMHVEALRQHDRKMVSSTRHRDIKEPTLLFDDAITFHLVDDVREVVRIALEPAASAAAAA